MYIVHLDFVPSQGNIIAGHTKKIAKFSGFEGFQRQSADLGEFVVIATDGNKSALEGVSVSMTITNTFWSDLVNVVNSSPIRIGDFNLYNFMFSSMRTITQKLATQHNLTVEQVRLIMSNGMVRLLITDNGELDECKRKLAEAEHRETSRATEIDELKAKLAKLRSAFDD
jgi:hypothetical protein